MGLPTSFRARLGNVDQVRSLRQVLSFNNLHSGCATRRIRRLTTRGGNCCLGTVSALAGSSVLPKVAHLVKRLGRRSIGLSITSTSGGTPIVLGGLNLFSGFSTVTSPSGIRRNGPTPSVFLTNTHTISLSPGSYINIRSTITKISTVGTTGVATITINSPRRLKGTSTIIPAASSFDCTLFRRA